jgi:hypothetical protein
MLYFGIEYEFAFLNAQGQFAYKNCPSTRRGGQD